MDIRFENTYEVTKAEYKKWSRVDIWRSPSTYCWLLLMLVSIIFFIFLALFLVIEVFCIYRAFFREKLIRAFRYKKMARCQGSNQWKRTILFGERIKVINGDVITIYDWSGQITIRALEEYTVFVSHDSFELVVKNDGFTKGNIDELIELIIQKTGQIKYTEKPDNDITGNFNNLIAIGIQIAIIVAFWYLEWTTSEVVMLIFSYSAFLMYFIGGFLLMSPATKYGFLSVSSVFAILLIHPVQNIFGDNLIIDSVMANPINEGVFHLLSMASVYSATIGTIVSLFTAAVPSMLMYLGILTKRYYRKQKKS
jgi:hypothetical protein